MASRKVSPQFRARLSEKLMELGNLVAAVLILGQFVGDKGFSLNIVLIGAILMGACYLASYIVNS